MANESSHPAATACGACIAVVVVLAGLGSMFGGGYADGTVVAIQNVQTGKFLTMAGNGVLHVSSNSTRDPSTHFKLVALSRSAVDMLLPSKKVAAPPSGTKNLCPCSGFSDEHGFGRFCHGWESEFHRPWCYVGEACPGARHGYKLRKHQACTSEEGYLGPDGYKHPPECPCSGHESVHGFGAYCRGWEFAGQTPWCYVHDNCSLVESTGSFAEHAECVSNVSSPPPPPPSPPNPPPPPNPPTRRRRRRARRRRRRRRRSRGSSRRRAGARPTRARARGTRTSTGLARTARDGSSRGRRRGAT